MKKIKVSILSYTNSKPFLYGIQKSGFVNQIELQEGLSFECAQRLGNNEVDLALVPVAALHHYPDLTVVGDFCIGAVMPVNSVFIFSSKPIEDIKTIKYDPQSRTSNHLAKVLFKNKWAISPTETQDNADAFVLIGDATFGRKEEFEYVYDLAEEWILFSGYPFAFAVWATNKSIKPEFLSAFNKALKLGVDNRKQVIAALPASKNFDVDDYLMNRISYEFDDDKKTALNMFLELI